MRIRILLQISDDDGAVGAAEEMAVFEKAAERPEDIGLSGSVAKIDCPPKMLCVNAGKT